MKRTKKSKELELEIIYGELFDKMVELVLRTNEPQMVASTMMAQSYVYIKLYLNTKVSLEKLLKQ
jgi:hypothetical protein